MSKCKDLLLMLLPSASSTVRRAAAEALGLVATLGVVEDAHFMQSTVLHALDEVVRGCNAPDGRPKTLIALEPVSAARSGSLLCLSCIQRTTHQVSERQQTRARLRSASEDADEEALRSMKEKQDAQDAELPLLQMMSRLLPSVSSYGYFSDYFVVRTYALHSFALLISYSGLKEESEVDLQLLRKSVELIEGNFATAWTASSHDIDKGQEGEKMATEAAFLSVLVRLMTLVVPYVGRLARESPGLPQRFSLIATLILESYSYHPKVYVECMAFFEVLSAHRHLLSAPSAHVHFTENPIYSCIPHLIGGSEYLKPAVFALDSADSMSIFNPRLLRAGVYLAGLLTEYGFRVCSLTQMKAVSYFMGALELASTNRYFFGGSLLRNIAATRSERDPHHSFDEIPALEKEILASVSQMLASECSFTDDSDTFLRWILYSRAILSGSSSLRSAARSDDSDDGPTRYSRDDVARAALVRASKDASLVYEASKIPRWQVKTLAAHLAATALEEMIQISLESGTTELKDDPDFDIRLATKECARLCREAQQQQQDKSAPLPKSRLAFHMEEVLSSACISSAATLDHSELRLLQSSSVLFLGQVVRAFGRIPDLEHPEDESILEQYSTQIYSSVKHALSAPDECAAGSDSLENSVGLFLAGAQALGDIINVGLTKDKATLKRLMRPVVPSGELIPFVDLSVGNRTLFSGGSDERNNDDTTAGEESAGSSSDGLVTISKITASAKLFSGLGCGEDAAMISILESLAAELIDDQVAFATNCAATALDGARLLWGSKLSLVGTTSCSSSAHHAKRLIPKVTSGLLFEDVGDITDTVKCRLAGSWSTCASYAIGPLLTTLAEADNGGDTDRAEKCKEWLSLLVPLLFAGIRESCHVVVAVARDGEEGRISRATDWASDLDPSSVLVDCLRGLQKVASSFSNSEAPGFDIKKWDSDIDKLLGGQLGSLIVEHSGFQKKDDDAAEDFIVVPTNVISEVCVLLTQLASRPAPSEDGTSALLRLLLTPLDLLEKMGDIEFKGRNDALIVSTSLSSVGALIASGRANEDVARAVVKLVLKSVLGSSDGDRDVRDAGVHVLCQCLRHPSLNAYEKQRIVTGLATQKNWEAWAEVVGSVLLLPSADGSGGDDTDDDALPRAATAAVVVAPSLDVLGACLRGSDDGSVGAPPLSSLSSYQSQAKALKSTCGLVQRTVAASSSASPNNNKDAVIGLLLNAIGADVLLVLLRYGTCYLIPREVAIHQQQRTAVFADALKILLIGYQQLSSSQQQEGEQDESAAGATAYLVVLFETLLAVLRYNGLPNHPPPHTAGATPDPAFGRMSSQAALNVARTSPALFKSSMAQLSDHDRALLEFAVRGEMTGYVAAGASGGAASQQKLSLKKFKA